jgi:hypothetical protein
MHSCRYVFLGQRIKTELKESVSTVFILRSIRLDGEMAARNDKTLIPSGQ